MVFDGEPTDKTRVVIIPEGTTGSLAFSRANGYDPESRIDLGVTARFGHKPLTYEGVIKDLCIHVPHHVGYGNIPYGGVLFVFHSVNGRNFVIEQLFSKFNKNIVSLTYELDNMTLTVADLQERLRATADSDLLVEKMRKLAETVEYLRKKFKAYSPDEMQGGFGMGGGFGGEF